MKNIYMERYVKWIKLFISSCCLLVSVSLQAQIANGTYKLTARHSSKVLDVVTGSTRIGANVQQLTANGSTAQEWVLTATTDGYYKIINKGSSKALEVAGSSIADGANVQQGRSTGSANQQWKIEATTDGFYRILNRNSGKTLEVAGSSTADGANVQQWTYGGGTHQQWNVETVSAPVSGGISLTINKNTKHQTIDGFGFFGARNVWWGSSDPAHFYSEAWLDMIVSDLGVSIWRNELYPHNPPTSNTTPNQDAHWDKQRPIVQALKAKADQYGVDMKVILSVWSPPGEFKWQSSMTWAGDENATRGPSSSGDYYSEKNGGTLNPNKYNEFAAWLSQGIQMYKNAGVNVYALSPQNEPMFAQSFNSCTYTSQWYVDMINAVIPKVKAQHPGLKIFGSENMLDMEGASHNYPYFYHNKLKTDPTALNHIDMLAVHGYLDGVSASSGSELAGYWTNHKREFSQPANKKAWMTETSGYEDAWEGGRGGSVPGALSLAIDMQTALYHGDLSAWVHWQGSELSRTIGPYVLMNDLKVGKKYYASKNFYRFIRPGAVRLATTSPDPDVSLTAYEHAANGTHTVVLINTATADKTIKLAMTGTSLPTTFEMFVTSASKNCESAGNVSASSSITLPARSVVTLQAGGMPLAGSASAAQARMAPEEAGTIQTARLEGITVYPNPSNGMVSVATGEAKVVKATMTTIHGVLVHVEAKQLDAGTLSFDISGQPTGIYLLRLEADGKRITYKIIKE